MKELKFNGDRIISGTGALRQLTELTGQRCAIVTGGQSMFANGTIARLQAMLEAAGKICLLVAGIPKNPDTACVLEACAALRGFAPDTVIAVGGGSPIDAAKVMTLFYEYPELTFADALAGRLPSARTKTVLIAVPSTSGTGTEVTKTAVVTFKERNLKIGLKTEAFIPDIAILDPELTMSMPDNIVAETGADALTHALECYINSNLDDFTAVMAEGAAIGLLQYLPQSYREKTLVSREKVHNYQCLAGMAFHNVGLGMAHGISHAFGGKYNVGHGLLNGIALPYVLRFNAERSPQVAAKLAVLAGRLGVSDLVAAVQKLNQEIKLPLSFQEAGISETDFIKDFAELVDNSLQGSTARNPVKVSKTDMEGMLQRIFYGKMQ